MVHLINLYIDQRDINSYRILASQFVIPFLNGHCCKPMIEQCLPVNFYTEVEWSMQFYCQALLISYMYMYWKWPLVMNTKLYYTILLNMTYLWLPFCRYSPGPRPPSGNTEHSGRPPRCQEWARDSVCVITRCPSGAQIYQPLAVMENKSKLSSWVQN